MERILSPLKWLIPSSSYDPLLFVCLSIEGLLGERNIDYCHLLAAKLHRQLEWRRGVAHVHTKSAGQRKKL